MSKPILWIVIPCYNEEAVLPSRPRSPTLPPAAL